MSEQLIQKYGFFRRTTYELTDTGVRGERSGLFQSTEFFVVYEDIGSRLLRKRSGAYAWLIGSVVCLLITVFLLVQQKAGDLEEGPEAFYLTLGAVLAIIFGFTFKQECFLFKPGSSNALEFIYSKRSMESVNNFIDALLAKRDRVLELKYGRMNPMLSYEQNHQNLTRLRDNDVITEEEFKSRIRDLNAMFRYPFERKMGFDLSEN